MLYVHCDIPMIARRAEYRALSGTEDETPDPYQVAIQEALETMEMLRAMRGHSHAWSAEGFCEVCGADGNA